MRIFKILWKSKKKAGTWISFETHSLGKPLMFCLTRNSQYTQWFCHINIFPISVSKNNSEFKIGISLVKYFIGFRFHLNFSINERKRKVKSIEVAWTI